MSESTNDYSRATRILSSVLRHLEQQFENIQPDDFERVINMNSRVIIYRLNRSLKDGQ